MDSPPSVFNYCGQEREERIGLLSGGQRRNRKGGWKDGTRKIVQDIQASALAENWTEIYCQCSRPFVWEGSIKHLVIFKHDHRFREIMSVLNAD